MVTGFSLMPGLLAGVAVAFDQFGLACALATFSSLCDLLDGLLAREGKTSSDAGELFDATVDRHVEFFLMGGLVFHYRQQPLILILSLLALLGAFMVSYTTAKAEALRIEPPRGAMRRAERAIYLITATGLTPFCQTLTSGSNPFIREAPLVIATIVVALVSNVSSAKRQLSIAHQIRERDGANCRRPSTRPPEAKPLDVGEYRIAAEPPAGLAS
jgi:phosphatidylglycerophosphate synthase